MSNYRCSPMSPVKSWRWRPMRPSSRRWSMALQQGVLIESFIDNALNFRTYAETYRVTTLDILGQIARRTTVAA